MLIGRRMLIQIIISFCFQRDPRLHHHASGGPSMSPEIARSARLNHADLGPLPVRILTVPYGIWNIESFFPSLLHVAAIIQL